MKYKHIETEGTQWTVCFWVKKVIIHKSMFLGKLVKVPQLTRKKQIRRHHRESLV